MNILDALELTAANYRERHRMHTEEKTQAQRNAEVQRVANRQVQFMFPRYVAGDRDTWMRVAIGVISSR